MPLRSRGWGVTGPGSTISQLMTSRAFSTCRGRGLPSGPTRPQS